MKKTCPKCNLLKDINDFGVHKSSHSGDGHGYVCRKCLAIRMKVYRENNKERERKKQIKFGGKKSFDIEQSVFVDWYTKVEKRCIYCEVHEKDWIKLGNNYSKRYKRLTIDRMDNAIGYEIDNIVLACFRCNIIKSDILSVKEMKEVAKKYITPKVEKELFR